MPLEPQEIQVNTIYSLEVQRGTIHSHGPGGVNTETTSIASRAEPHIMASLMRPGRDKWFKINVYLILQNGPLFVTMMEEQPEDDEPRDLWVDWAVYKPEDFFEDGTWILNEDGAPIRVRS